MPWWDTHITQPFKWGWSPGGRGQPGTVNGHSGIDLAEANGTPLTAAVTGQVVAAGARAWGGQVSILFDIAPGMQAVCTCIHMSDIAPGIQEGVHVQAGQLIGLTGGGRNSSPIPTTCCSTGPHLHFELSMGNEPPYWHSYEPYKPDKSHYPIDPTNFWLSIKRNGIPNDQSQLAAAIGLGTSVSGAAAANASSTASPTAAGPIDNGPGAQAHAALVELPGFAGIAIALDRGESFIPYTPPGAPADPSLSLPLGQSVSLAGVGAIEGEIGVMGYTAQWLGANALALLLRLLLVVFGFGLVAALLYATVRRSAVYQGVQQGAQQAAQVAAVAAV